MVLPVLLKEKTGRHQERYRLSNMDSAWIISGKYEMKPDEKGRLHYILENGTDIQESDGICLFVGSDREPDYKIISIKPYRMLTLEVEKL